MCYYAHILRISPRLVPLYTERIHSPSSNSTKSSVASGEHELITELRPDDLPRINAVPQGAQTGWRWSGKMDMATEYHAGIRQAPHKYHLSIMQISIEKCTLRTPCVPSTPFVLETNASNTCKRFQVQLQHVSSMRSFESQTLDQSRMGGGVKAHYAPVFHFLETVNACPHSPPCTALQSDQCM